MTSSILISFNISLSSSVPQEKSCGSGTLEMSSNIHTELKTLLTADAWALLLYTKDPFPSIYIPYLSVEFFEITFDLFFSNPFSLADFHSLPTFPLLS